MGWSDVIPWPCQSMRARRHSANLGIEKDSRRTPERHLGQIEAPNMLNQSVSKVPLTDSLPACSLSPASCHPDRAANSLLLPTTLPQALLDCKIS